MPSEPVLADETPENLRNRARRYRQYARYFHNDPAKQALELLADELENKAIQMERRDAKQ